MELSYYETTRAPYHENGSNCQGSWLKITLQISAAREALPASPKGEDRLRDLTRVRNGISGTGNSSLVTS